MVGPAHTDLPVLGRAEELAAGHALLADLASGPRALVLEGDPGIGKTTVWRQLIHGAEVAGTTVLSCRAVQAEVKLVHVSLADLLAPVADDVIATLPSPQRDALEVALLRTGPSPGDVDPRAVGAGVVSVLSTLADESPVIVAVDDVQWLDGASAGALRFALRRLERRPVAIGVTVRGGLDDAIDPLGLVQALGPRVRRQRLGPLSVDRLHDLVHRRLGQALPRPTMHKIHEVSGGNPLFALELARALLDAGTRPEPGEPLPASPSLTALVADRVDALPARSREALLIAASLPAPTTGVIERASGAPASPALRDAADAGLIALRGDRVLFSHPMFATAVYTSASPVHRRAWHQRLGELATDAEERARHVALAVDGADAAAADLLDAAADEARRRGAPGVAGELLEWAARVTPVASRRAIDSRMVRAAEHHYRAGDLGHARSLLESVDVGSVDGSVRTRALRLLGEIRYQEASFGGSVALLEQALRTAGTAEASAEILLDLAFVHFSMGDVHRSVTAAQQARREAERSPARSLLAETLAVEANVGFFAGAGLDTEQVERALTLEDRGRDVQLLVRPSAIAALFALYAGRLSDAARAFHELRTWVSTRGEETDCIVLTWSSWTDSWRGHLDAATATAQEALALATQAGSDPARGVALMHRGLARTFLGDVAGAREDLQRSAIVVEKAGWMVVHAWAQWTLGFLELSVGDHEAAGRTFEPYTAQIEAHGLLEPFAVYFVPDAVEALITGGDLDRAERLLDAFDRRAQQLRRAWASAGAARCRALLLSARGDTVGAAQAIEIALTHAEGLEMPLERGRTMLARGQIHRRSRRKAAARDALERALADFEAIGARLWVERTRAELDRLGRRSRPGELTATEQRVAELAASGRTNREIAGLLFVSPKTVEANLAHVYRKFGIRSRAELGRTMATRDG